MSAPLPPVDALPCFVPERSALLDLLRGLAADQWARPTVCDGWCVKDLALHLLGDDLGILTRLAHVIDETAGGDLYGALLHKRAVLGRRVFAGQATETFAQLVPLINQVNNSWVTAVRRLSTAELVLLMERSGRAVHAYFATLDPMAISDAVHWAGPEPAPVWLHTAREYTEHWLHGQQIRDAVGAPPLTGRALFHPVLDAFIRALPYTYRGVAAAPDTCVRLEITGVAGGAWLIERDAAQWRLVVDHGGTADATVALDQDSAWRLFTKDLSPETARQRATLTGDLALCLPALTMVSILA